MNNIIRLLVIAFLVLSLANNASAWNVTLHNYNGITDTAVRVYGEHLFWRNAVDLTLQAAKGKVNSGSMPGGICPHSFQIEYCPKAKTIGNNQCSSPTEVFTIQGDVAKCANIEILISQMLDCTGLQMSDRCPVYMNIIISAPPFPSYRYSCKGRHCQQQ
jgi:hypothetical protein